MPRLKCLYTGDDTGLIKRVLLGEDDGGTLPLRRRGNVVAHARAVKAAADEAAARNGDDDSGGPGAGAGAGAGPGAGAGAGAGAGGALPVLLGHIPAIGQGEDRFVRKPTVVPAPRPAMVGGIDVVEGLEQTRAKGIVKLAHMGSGRVASLCVDGTSQVFNSLLQPATPSTKQLHGTPVALSSFGGNRLAAATSEGTVRVWDAMATESSGSATSASFDVDGPVHAMAPDPGFTCVAVGGRKTLLRVWDVESQACAWTARNVKKDFLDMAVPIWDTGVQFLSSSPVVDGGRAHVLATCTGHRHVRLYDTRADNRPISNIDVGDYPWKAMVHVPDGSGELGSVVVGDTTGTLLRVDLGTMRVAGAYGGLGGGVRGLAAHPDGGKWVASVSLDRSLRVHHVAKRTLKHTVYLKQRLTAVVFLDDVETGDSDSDSSDSVFHGLEQVGGSDSGSGSVSGSGDAAEDTDDQADDANDQADDSDNSDNSDDSDLGDLLADAAAVDDGDSASSGDDSDSDDGGGGKSVKPRAFGRASNRSAKRRRR